MTDIATLGIAIESGQAKTAASDLIKFSDSAKQAEVAVARVGKVAKETANDTEKLAQATKKTQEALAQTAQAAQSTSNVLARIEQTTGLTGAAARRTAQDIQAYGDELDRVRAKFNPLFAAGQQYKKTLQEISEASRQGAISEKESAAAITRTKEAFAARAREINGIQLKVPSVTPTLVNPAVVEQITKSSGNAQNALRNLTFQINDIGTSLASGISPFQTLAQQGGQVFQVWQQSPTVFGDAGRAIGGVLTPVRLLAGGAIAAGAAAIFMAEKYGSAMREVERSLAGTGRASGLTVQGINNIAEATANQQRISISAAREIAATYASSGIQAGPVAGLTAATRNFAAQTGQSTAEASEQLAKIFSDPIDGAEKLNKAIGGIDARTIAYVRTLTESNQKTAAQTVLLAALQPGIEGAADRVSTLQRKWEQATKAASDYFDRASRAVSGGTPQERLSGVNQEIARLEQRGVTPNAVFGGKASRDLKELLQQKDLLEGLITLEKQRTAFQAENNRRASLSNEVQEIVKGFDQAFEEAQRLTGQLAKIRDLQNIRGGDGSVQNFSIVQRYQEAAENAQKTRLTGEQRIREETSIQVRSTLARTAAEQLSVSLDRERLAMAGQIVDAKEREARIQQQIATAQASAAKEARDALRSANDNAALSGLLPYQRSVVEAQQRGRDLNERTNLPEQTPSIGGGKSLLDAIVRFESGGRNIAQQAVPPGGGYNPSTGTVTGPSSASGYFQMINPTWRRAAGLAGIDASQYPRAMDAPYDVQRQAAGALLQREGPGHWLPYNAGLRKYVNDNGGLGAFDKGIGGGGASKFGFGSGGSPETAAQRTEAMKNGTKAAQDFARENEFVNNVLRDSKIDLEGQKKAFESSEQAIMGGVRGMTSAAKEQEILNGFIRSGTPITAEMRAEVKKLADGYGELAAQQTGAKLGRDVKFEGSQIGRTSGEQQIASRLRGIYGEGYTSEINGTIANQIRFNNALEQTASLAEGAFGQITNGLLNGQNAGKVFESALKNIASQAINMAGNSLIRSIFGSISSSFTGGVSGLLGGAFSAGAGGYAGFGPFLASANGNAFSSGNVIPFARGGAFTNSIVSKPTLFPFANGTGLMGEAGPEAIMPLKRGPNGSLGVQMNGGTGGSTTVVQGNTNITITGNADQAAIAELRKQMTMRDKQFVQNVNSANRTTDLRRVTR
jgi:phage-related minor tail protein